MFDPLLIGSWGGPDHVRRRFLDRGNRGALIVIPLQVASITVVCSPRHLPIAGPVTAVGMSLVTLAGTTGGMVHLGHQSF